ncbi:unnamed protein product [Caenorhabditis auriculariae]|uniref:Uncharacterized protein n=1 Tax=Caenorhabditis auriculariae TaxID=2777116 RepID=A0A8S1GPG1_9PELO|nr:unnamed protein product [Caenorhabditis auriculariae]
MFKATLRLGQMKKQGKDGDLKNKDGRSDPNKMSGLQKAALVFPYCKVVAGPNGRLERGSESERDQWRQEPRDCVQTETQTSGSTVDTGLEGISVSFTVRVSRK